MYSRMGMGLLLLRANEVSGAGSWQAGPVLLEDNRIVAVGTQALSTAPDRVLEVEGSLLPGLIDLQVNGAGGRGVEECTTDALNTVARTVWSGGAVAFLPTLISAPLDDLLGQTAALADWIEAWDGVGARPLGIHLEGPFLEVPGAHPIDHLQDPETESVQALIDAARGHLRLLTLAPARRGAIEATAQLRAAGVCVSIGHARDDACLSECVAAGAQMVTHLFNAMSPLHHREPGIAGSCMADPALSCSLIVDGIHVHPTMVQNAFRCLGPERMVLVTDCMAAAGMPDGVYSLGSSKVTLADGQVRDSNGTLAGSAILMTDAVQRFLEYTSATDGTHVAQLASTNPAQLLGLADLGQIAQGTAPGFSLLTDDGHVQALALEE
ncbi:MAG TPA: N-acetylglucosamine-6-phosphate deacetylase [Planctomycetes bacterium]|nr:N-acetylglucosamine-6-phosphate deacetylase [Planctomycetota bacterium]HIK62110.1 N-acetylglucosamine-6-phosphate deacetylase [Planctomycetota bacterium]